MAIFNVNVLELFAPFRAAQTVERLFSFLLLTAFCASACATPITVTDTIAATKREHPPKPEADGLRLEVTAELDDAMTSDGKDWQWGGAHLSVDLALLNVSDTPITVSTTAYDEKPIIAPWGPGLERIMIRIEPLKFERSPTVFVALRYTPAVLAPGERVMLLRHRTWIKDQQQANTTREIYAVFDVARSFDGPKEWWRGRLQTYKEIKRRIDPEKYIIEARANGERYRAQKAAEQDPNYGVDNSARIAALIAGSDQARIRGEAENKTDEVTVNDPEWIKQVSAAIAATSLPRSTHCFCIGWRTAHFYKVGQLAVSVAAKHGNQLRISWPGGGGDYPIDEARWNVVKQALELPQKAGKP